MHALIRGWIVPQMLSHSCVHPSSLETENFSVYRIKFLNEPLKYVCSWCGGKMCIVVFRRGIIIRWRLTGDVLVQFLARLHVRASGL